MIKYVKFTNKKFSSVYFPVIGTAVKNKLSPLMKKIFFCMLSNY